ncbi:hypothetical protein BH11PLA2_BH11PLA2_45540 [soil metagenome]
MKVWDEDNLSHDAVCYNPFVKFLIDGYNLMHAHGFLGSGKRKLEPARRRFLDWLADSGRGREVAFHVIFDAVNAPGYSPEAMHRGVAVLFATGETADDRIEAILPKLLPGTVVLISNDTRLHESARRRGVRWWSCERFGDWILTGEVPPKEILPEPPEKPESVPAEETIELLKVFDPPGPKKPRGPWRHVPNV